MGGVLTIVAHHYVHVGNVPPTEEIFHKGVHPRHVRVFALKQRAYQRPDARLVARHRGNLARRLGALVAEAAAGKLAGEDRVLALPVHVKVIHKVVGGRVRGRVNDERPAWQVQSRYPRKHLAFRVLEQTELVHLGFEAAPAALPPRVVGAVRALEVLVFDRGHDRQEARRVVHVEGDRIDRAQSLLLGRLIHGLGHAGVVEPHVAPVDVARHLLLSVLLSDLFELEHAAGLLIVKRQPLLLSGEQGLYLALAHLGEEALHHLELLPFRVGVVEGGPLVREEENLAHIWLPLEDQFVLDHVLIRCHALEPHEGRHIHHHHWEGAVELEVCGPDGEVCGPDGRCRRSGGFARLAHLLGDGATLGCTFGAARRF